MVLSSIVTRIRSNILEVSRVARHAGDLAAPVPARRLQLQQRGEASAARDEIRRRAVLDDAAVIDDDDAVRFPGRREPVRDGQHRRAAGEHGRAQRVAQRRFAGAVHEGRGLVEQQHRRPRDQRAGQRQQLLLAGRELHARAAAGAAEHASGSRSAATRMNASAPLISAASITADSGTVSSLSVRFSSTVPLKSCDAWGTMPKTRRFSSSDSARGLASRDANRALPRLVQAGEEVDDAGLSRPGASHQRDVLPGRDVQGHAVQHRRSGRIAEDDVLADEAVPPLRSRRRRRLLVGGQRQHLEDALRARQRALHRLPLVAQRGHRREKALQQQRERGQRADRDVQRAERHRACPPTAGRRWRCRSSARSSADRRRSRSWRG